ncbi:MAG TPA: zf-HC2 domain-containing protein [Mycobacteriales bacterium]|nr:zf-HC2 domain-containing protein [Mycobacteriales bacterium]
MTCAELADAAPELVLGTLDGERRAAAVAHLAGCAACRLHVEELARTADALWLAAPAAEPPAGFEARVLAAAARTGRSRWRRVRPWVRALAVAAAAVLLVAGGVVAGRAGRGGPPVAAGPMYDTARVRVGSAIVSGGDPAYVFVTVDDWPHDGDYLVEVVAHDGRHVPVTPIHLTAGRGDAGGRLPLAYRDVRAVWVTDAAHTEWCAFRLG